MSSRSALLLLLLVLGCAAASPLRAQTPGSGALPRGRLEDLRKDWKDTSAEYLRVRAGIDASAARLAQDQKAYDAQLQVLGAAERRQQAAWTPWEKILSRRALEEAKRGLRTVSDELQRERQEGDHLRQREGVLRLDLVQTGRGLCERLIERADELRLNQRGKQADEYYAEALDVMRLVEDLEAAEKPPEPPPALPDLQDEVRERSAKQLEELAGFYEDLASATRKHLDALRPEEKALGQRLEHLERLTEARVVLPTLAERRERARKALERVATLREGLELRATRYHERSQALEAALRERVVEESQRDRAVQEGGG